MIKNLLKKDWASSELKDALKSLPKSFSWSISLFNRTGIDSDNISFKERFVETLRIELPNGEMIYEELFGTQENEEYLIKMIKDKIKTHLTPETPSNIKDLRLSVKDEFYKRFSQVYAHDSTNDEEITFFINDHSVSNRKKLIRLLETMDDDSPMTCISIYLRDSNIQELQAFQDRMLEVDVLSTDEEHKEKFGDF